MPAALLGKKIGMTRLYDDQGRQVPVTVIQAGQNFVSQIKTSAKDGYAAVQLAFEEIKARNSTMPKIGHDAAAGVAPQRFHREVRLTDQEAGEYSAGQTLGVDVFEGVGFVDVVGTSKGKGFAGTIKRWNFKGQPASHGTERKHRSPGSIGGHATNRGFSGRPKKGKLMAGHMGSERVTVRSLALVRIDKDNGLLMVKGAVPGPNKGLVYIRKAVRLSKGKAKLAAAS